MTNIISILKKPFVILGKHKASVNNFLPYFFLSYFIIVFLPYVVADIPVLNTFFMGSITKLFFRALTTAYLCIYGLMLGIINKQGIKWPFVICGIILFVCYLSSIIFAPKIYKYVTVGSAHRVDFYEFYIGNYSYVTYGFSFLADVVTFVIFISYFPYVMKSANQLYPTLLFLISVMLIACFYSLIKERQQILRLLHGESEYNVIVRSFFHSKNAFGLFLVIGTICSAFMIGVTKCNLRWFFIFPLLLFPLMSLLSMCKSALLVCVLTASFVPWYFVFFSKRLSFYISLFLVIIMVSIIVVLFLVVSIPVLREGIFLGVYNLLSKLFRGIFTRTDSWLLIKYIVYGPFIVIGMNESNSTFVLDIMSKVTENKDIIDFHSAYVTWYAHHGIIGCLIYCALLFYIVYKIIIVFKKQKKDGFLLFAIFVSCLLLMIPESYTLFISISAYSFIINLILVCFVEFLSNKAFIKEEKIDE